MHVLIVILAALSLACGTTSRSQDPLTQEGINPLKGEFLLGVGQHFSEFALEDGTRVEILYEGNSTFGLLTKPGLKFTLPDSSSHYTSGLGYFELGQHTALVERVAGTRTSPAHLQVSLMPPKDGALLPTKESTELVLQKLRSEGIGFDGYAWQLRGHLIEVVVYKEDDIWLLQASLDRLTGKIQNLRSFQAMLPTGDIARKTVENLYFQDALVLDAQGSPEDIGGAQMLEKAFSECAIFETPTSAYVSISGSNTQIDYAGDYAENSFEIRFLRECVDKVLAEQDFSEISFRVDFVYESTFVRSSSPGKSPSLVTPINPTRDVEIAIIFENGSPTTRNEVRGFARRDWSQIASCGTRRTTYQRTEGASFSPLSEADCLKGTLAQWVTTSQEPAQFTLVVK